MTLTDLVFKMILNSLHGYLVTVEGPGDHCEIIRSDDLEAIGVECWKQRQFTMFMAQKYGNTVRERAVISFDLDADYARCIVSASDQHPESDPGHVVDMLCGAETVQRLFAREFALRSTV